MYQNSAEYQAIQSIYGDQKTLQGNGVPFMNHINEGLHILHRIKASDNAQRAYCLHPIMQVNGLADEFLSSSYLKEVDPRALVTAGMFANTVNAFPLGQFISGNLVGNVEEAAGLIKRNDVMDMILAEMVQNYKDFLNHEGQTDPDRAEINEYFLTWLRFLAPHYLFKNEFELFDQLKRVFIDSKGVSDCVEELLREHPEALEQIRKGDVVVS